MPKIPGVNHLDAVRALQKAGMKAASLLFFSLVRSQALFHREGFATALVDAPSDHTGDDGQGGLRAQRPHAEDLGKR